MLYGKQKALLMIIHLTRLRTKLEELDLKELIETRRGQGYIIKGEKEN